MKNILRVFISDVKKISTNVVALVVVLGLIVIPSLYAWFNILSNWDPYGESSTSQIKVAVASDDEGADLDMVNVNVSDSIIEALKGNKTIGWVFLDDSFEAIKGVYSGEYYAALVMPEDFSSDMVSFLTDSLEHPQIYYYTNQKKNAIAPKITDKAKTAVREQVNETFIKTIASSLVSTGNSVMNSEQMSELGVTEDSSLLEIITAKLQHTNDELSTYNTLLTSLMAITDMSMHLSDASTVSSEHVNEILENEQVDIAAVQKLVNANKLESLDSISKSMSENLSSIQNIMKSISSIYSDMNGTVNDFNSAMADSQTNLAATKELVVNLQDKLSNIINTLQEFTDSDKYSLLTQILEADSATLGEFIASPVSIDTEKIYEVDSYGSAASPFYTILSIWVGGLIMVAIIHAHVKKSDSLPKDLKPYQAFFGRYLVYFGIGQLQTLLIVLGNMFYINIQCRHPIMFWFACSVASMVFTFFMYSLAVAFGNIGEALAVIFMVVQVAGSGGTFPIEVLPKVYRMIYKYLPFPYAMDALRETIGGLYQNYYWKCLGCMCVYILISLIIGLVCRKPFEKMNELIEKSKEKSGVML